MQRIWIFTLGIGLSINCFSQSLERPKLVVGIVVDQMRWDYLYRYYDRYSPHGFKRLLNGGFSCENTMIPYVPTVTAPGHASIYTGSFPSIHGIAGNSWWDNEWKRNVYCTEDKMVKTVGSNSSLGEMSPRNMIGSTICDELKLATNFRSKVISISIKDRGSIFAGHSADAAYWYDNTNGHWITSTFYMNELPKWLQDFNAKKWVDKYYEQGWNTLYPIKTYLQSTDDENSYESKPFGVATKGFPYDLKNFIGKNYGIIGTTPHGNTLTAEIAKAAVIHEQLGADGITDFLAISFSSPDLIGHAFGPNSIEQEDDFLRFDNDIADLLNFLDNKVGKDQFLLFLSADHGVAQIPTYLKEKKIPAGSANFNSLAKSLNDMLNEKYKRNDLVFGIYNSKVSLHRSLIDSLKMDYDDIKRTIIDFLSVHPSVVKAFDITKTEEAGLNEKLKKMVMNGYYPRRNGDIQVISHPQWLEYFSGTGTTHGTWYPYDAHIPLIWYGWKIRPGKLNREVYLTDIAPTLGALLNIQAPSGSIGNTIEEVLK